MYLALHSFSQLWQCKGNLPMALVQYITSLTALAVPCYFTIIIIIMYLYAISPYTTGLKALFKQSDCTGTAPTHK